MGQEIERRFILKEEYVKSKLTNIQPTQIIVQGYLATGEDEVRIRQVISSQNNRHFLTIKRGRGLVREEIEHAISVETYAQLTKGVFLFIKYRYLIPWKKLTLELNLFQDKFGKTFLALAEVEFPSKENALSFQAPEFFGQDVTEDTAYNSQLIAQAIQMQRVPKDDPSPEDKIREARAKELLQNALKNISNSTGK